MKKKSGLDDWSKSRMWSPGTRQETKGGQGELSGVRSSGHVHTLEELLLQLGLGDLDLDGLVDLLLVAALVVCIVLDGGGEEGVDEGGLAQARLASNLPIKEQSKLA